MKKNILFVFVVHFTLAAFSQNADSTKLFTAAVDTLQKADKRKTFVSGAVTATNNGISLVPAFSLEKPAAIFDLTIKRNKFSFEPEFAFGFEDVKPWYFVFWFRYKLIETSRFNLVASFHPGFLFSTTNVVVDRVNKEYFTTARFFVGALSPNFTPSKDVSIGIYYQYGRGYNIDLKQSHFLGANCNISNIRLGSTFFMKVAPQVYYLNNDAIDGFYINSSVTLAKTKSPFSIATLLNKKLQSHIPGKNFIWNLSFIYSY